MTSGSDPVPETALLTPSEMKKADEAADRLGRPVTDLAREAARVIVSEIEAWGIVARRVAVLAGSGMNGTDGRLAAALLAMEGGGEVRVFALEPQESGEAALADFDPAAFDLVVDALFGAGLSRPVEGATADAVARLNASGMAVLAVDLPSGIDGRTGDVLGIAVKASRTVTFERRKPGHLLLPGRRHCGRTVVKGIGLPAEALRAAYGSRLHANEPALWQAHLLTPDRINHKYDRGHAVVLSGPASQTGAARLSASAALRGGAGLVTLATPSSALLVNAAHLTAVMLKRCDDAGALGALLADERLNAYVLGPGFGVGPKACDFAERILLAGRRLVLDADAITSFRDEPHRLFSQGAGEDGEPRLVLTPHDGEFARLFPDLTPARGVSKIERASEAARRAGAVVILKGSDTVIAAPDGRAAVNASGTAWLATAGTGDVLAGLIAAQLANGLPAFEAACAAVWIHGRAAELYGPGLISEDLPALVPSVLRELVAG